MAALKQIDITERIKAQLEQTERLLAEERRLRIQHAAELEVVLDEDEEDSLSPRRFSYQEEDDGAGFQLNDGRVGEVYEENGKYDGFTVTPNTNIASENNLKLETADNVETPEILSAEEALSPSSTLLEMPGAIESTVINETSKSHQSLETASADSPLANTGKIDYLKEYSQKYGINEEMTIKNIQSKIETVAPSKVNSEDLISKYLRDKAQSSQSGKIGDILSSEYSPSQVQFGLFNNQDGEDNSPPYWNRYSAGLVDMSNKSTDFINEGSEISQLTRGASSLLSEPFSKYIANQNGSPTTQSSSSSVITDGDHSPLPSATARRQLFAQQRIFIDHKADENFSERISKSLPPTPEKSPRSFEIGSDDGAPFIRSSLSKSKSEPERLVPWRTKFHIPSFEEFKLRRKYGGSVPNIAGISPESCSNNEMFPSSFSMTNSSSMSDLRHSQKDRNSLYLKGSGVQRNNSEEYESESPAPFGQTYTLNTTNEDFGVKSHLRTSQCTPAISPSTSNATSSPQSSWETHVQSHNPTVPKIMTKTGQSVDGGHSNSPRGYRSMQKIFGLQDSHHHHRSKSLEDSDGVFSKSKVPMSTKDTVNASINDGEVTKEKLRRCKSDKSCQSPRVTFSDEVLMDSQQRRRKSKSDLGNVSHLLEQASGHDNESTDEVKVRKSSKRSRSHGEEETTRPSETADEKTNSKNSPNHSSRKRKGKSKSDLGIARDVVNTVQHQQKEKVKEEEQKNVPSGSSSRQKPKRHVKEDYEKYLRKYQMDSDFVELSNGRSVSSSRNHSQLDVCHAKSDSMRKVVPISRDDSEICISSFDKDNYRNKEEDIGKKKKGKSKPPRRPHSSLGLSSRDASFLPGSGSKERKEIKNTVKKDQEESSIPIKQGLYTKKKDYKVSIEPDLENCMATNSNSCSLELSPIRDNCMLLSSPREPREETDVIVPLHQRLGDVEMLDLDLSSLESDLEFSEHTLHDNSCSTSSSITQELDSSEKPGSPDGRYLGQILTGKNDDTPGTCSGSSPLGENLSAESSPRHEVTASPRFNNYVEALKSGNTAPRSDDLFTKYSKRFKRLEQTELSQVPVTRSTSDVSDIKEEKKRKKDKKPRHNKSDPFDEVALERQNFQKDQKLKTKENRSSKKVQQQKHEDGSKRKLSSATSKEEILSFLQEVQAGSFETPKKSSSLQSLEEIYEDDTSSEDTPKGAEVERVDSGVGSETKAGMKKKNKGPICEDCNRTISVLDLEDSLDTLCTRCHSRRVERKETIQELVDTELSYGRDLLIIKEEFMAPMETASLLSSEQLETIFINLDELIDINDKFADKLQDLVEMANEQGDEDYVTVYIGQLFLESSNMFLAFENYCVKQAAAPLLLEQLEKEKELLRIFLHVSQTENSLLRRMNLKSFLMVPVQRIMKYPLLLGRLYKSTSSQHEDKEAIREAQCKVEEILDHINAKTKGSTGLGLRLRRKGSGSKKAMGTDNIELNKVALETLNWTRNEVNIISAEKLQFAQPADSTWPKKYRNLKFSPIYGVLATLGKPKPYNTLDVEMLFPRPHTVPQQAALVIIREKGGRFQAIREPLYLDKCVVAVDPDLTDVFEIHEMGKDIFLFKAEDTKDTTVWYRHLKYLSLGQGSWRRRRNGLANIMMKNKSKAV